jgi:hypothetical protein
VGSDIDDADYDRPRDHSSPSHQAFARDWGSLVARTPTASFDPDNGLVLGASVDWLRYGFRRHPYARRFGVDVAFGTLTGLPRASVELEMPGVAGGLGFLASATVSGLERNHFYGFGNETVDEPPTEPPPPDAETGEAFFRAERWDARLAASARWKPTERILMEAGPFLRYTVDRDEEQRLVGALAPPGSGSFQEAGVALRAGWDARDAAIYPTSGVSVAIEALAAPALLDVEEAFARGAVDASAYLTAMIPFEATLGLRARGERIEGDAPYHEASYIGGRRTLRGLHSDRYAGDASFVSTAELRIPLFHFRALVPGELGLLGLADIGRVWVDGEASDTWHAAGGGGVFFAVLNRRAAFSVYLARGGGRTAVYAGKAITF